MNFVFGCEGTKYIWRVGVIKKAMGVVGSGKMHV